MTQTEALKLALEAHKNAITAIKEALAQPEQKVDWEKLYRLEVKKKEALAAKYEQDIKPLTKIVPMAQPCPTCEALARAVMMDQTGRDA